MKIRFFSWVGHLEVDQHALLQPVCLRSVPANSPPASPRSCQGYGGLLSRMLDCHVALAPGLSLTIHPPMTELYCKHCLCVLGWPCFAFWTWQGKLFERDQHARGLCNAAIWPKRTLRGLICPGTMGVEAVQEPWRDWGGCTILLSSSGFYSCSKTLKGQMRGQVRWQWGNNYRFKRWKCWVVVGKVDSEAVGMDDETV